MDALSAFTKLNTSFLSSESRIVWNRSQGNNLILQSSVTPLKIVSDEVLSIISVVVKCALYQVFSVVGILTNSVNLIIFWRLGFKETINVSLFAMSVSDIGSLVSLFWMGICYNPIFADSDISFDSRSVQYLTGGWPKFYFTRVSGLITAYVTFERCLCTVIPLKVKSILTPKRVSVIIAVIFIAIALTISPVYVSTQFGQRWYPGRNTSLVGLIFSANKETVNSITLGLSVLLCDGSFLFVATGTIILVLNLNKSRQWKETAARTADKRLSKETKASKMVTLIAVVFITCLLPGSLFSLAMIAVPEFNSGESQQNLFFASWSFAHISEAINASVNMFIYVHMSTRFKREFCKTFGCLCNSKERKDRASSLGESCKGSLVTRPAA